MVRFLRLALVLLALGSVVPGMATTNKIPTPDTQQQWVRTVQNQFGANMRTPPELAGLATPRFQVLLRMTIRPDGTLSSSRVARSSGHAAVDKAALRAVRLAKLPPFSRDMGSKARVFTLPVVFHTPKPKPLPVEPSRPSAKVGPTEGMRAQGI